MRLVYNHSGLWAFGVMLRRYNCELRVFAWSLFLWGNEWSI